jgi:hypothetical protein
MSRYAFRAEGIVMNPLNETVRIGRHTLRNRLVMAPMTRSRADDATGAPSPRREVLRTARGRRPDHRRRHLPAADKSRRSDGKKTPPIKHKNTPSIAE